MTETLDWSSCDGPQYRVLVERSRNTGRAKEALVEATNNRNLKELQEAIGVRGGTSREAGVDVDTDMHRTISSHESRMVGSSSDSRILPLGNRALIYCILMSRGVWPCLRWPSRWAWRARRWTRPCG